MSSPQDERHGWLDLALAMCDETDAIALAAYRADHAVERKPDGSLVTSADREIEARLRERIRTACPDHGLVGEEYGPEDAARPVRWYLDPIDGTSNFVRGVPVFATLVAVERDEEREVAVVSAPAFGTRWSAVRGEGAWSIERDGRRRRLKVSSVAHLGDAHLLYRSLATLRASGAVPGFDAVVARAARDRGFGDFWGHVLVAEGAAEAMIETDLRPWDIAAPMLIVEEAGGRGTDLAGVRNVTGPSLVTSNGAVHDELLRELRG